MFLQKCFEFGFFDLDLLSRPFSVRIKMEIDIFYFSTSFFFGGGGN